MTIARKLTLFAALFVLAFSSGHSAAQSAATLNGARKVILDTDIGDDIDDAFALALAISNPNLKVVLVTAAWGDTDLRARLTARFLAQTGHEDIPVAAGKKTGSRSVFTQRRWAERFPQPKQPWPDAVDAMIDVIRRNPGQITLISIAPLTNVGELIDRDPAAFHLLKQVVIMGGSIYRGYGDLGYTLNHGPDPEYNILLDIPSARKLFGSGVPVYVMPLDSTQLKFDEVMRNTLFSQGTPVTNALAGLYEQWTASTLNPTPTLFDAMAVAATVDPHLCPTTPMHIEVDNEGYTRPVQDKPNAYVCLQSDSDKFFHSYFKSVLASSSPSPDSQYTR